MAATPVALPQSVTVTANGSVTITLEGRDSDGDTLTYGIFSPPPSHGFVTTPTPTGNQVTYTPTAGYTGTDSFVFKVTDNQTFSNSATVTITVKEDDFLLTFVTTTLIPIIKQKQDQALQDYINNLTITDPTILSCFTGTVPQGSALYNLTTLTCEGKDLSTPSAMADLGKLINLQTLELRYSKLADISALSKLTKLTRLDLEFNELTDSSANALSKMTNLEYLNLRFNDFTTTSFLSGMNKLTELHLEANEINDISYLSGKTTLKKLWLDDNRFTNISYLSGLNGLTHLGLGYNTINDISPLTNLSSLQILVLDGNDITANATTGTGALANMGALQELYLRGNNINVIGSNTLFPSTQQLWLNLKILELGFNQIENISVLSTMVNLTRLGLEYNQITDASALYGLTNLKHIALDNNLIRKTGDLTGSGLKNLSGLNSYLDLRGNLLLDIAPLASMTNTFTLLADDNCLGSIVMPSNVKAFGKDWQFPPNPRCDDPTVDDKPVAYAQNISIYENTDKAITFGGADPEGGTITYAIVSNPTHGQILSFSTSTGTFTYRPNSNYTGTDTITFSVTDSKPQTSQATVQISVLPTSLISDPALQSCFTNGVPTNTALLALTEFKCDGKDLSGADLTQLGILPSLTSVILLHANLSNTSALNNLGANWTFFDVRYNNITDVSTLLANKTNVVTLGLESNKLTDISVLANLTHLQAIYADNNNIGSGGLPSLNNLTNLGTLTLRQNRLLTSDMQTAWGSAMLETSLTIHLENNCLTANPVLPSTITIKPTNAASGLIEQQRPPNGSVCNPYGQ